MFLRNSWYVAAWDREVSAGHASRLFQKDGSHPSAYGNEVIAKVFYQTLFLKRK